MERETKLRTTDDSYSLDRFEKEKKVKDSSEGTNADSTSSNLMVPTSLFRVDSRDGLVTLVGFSEKDIAN